MNRSRRRFLGWMGAAAAVSATPFSFSSAGARTERRVPPHAGSRPIAISSGNGLRGVELAFKMMRREGADPLDAAIAGVNIQELDPDDQSVGLGGLPNEEGVVQLDASCMHGPTRRAGAVAALEGIATASSVAKAVMDHTDHVMLVGEGAKKFALRLGFEEQDLLTGKSRRAWLRWRKKLNPDDDWLDPAGEPPPATDGTIHISAVDAKGDIGSVTTTSGLSWKIPGRIGDSPIVGAGQYCHNEFGSAGSTGRGEAALKACGAFYVVEMMRRGREPVEACREALHRVVETTESRLLDPNGLPLFHLKFYAVSKDGRYGAATFYEMNEREKERNYHLYAVADRHGPRLEPFEFLFDLGARPKKMG